jgi:hypothetical protein
MGSDLPPKLPLRNLTPSRFSPSWFIFLLTAWMEAITLPSIENVEPVKEKRKWQRWRL